MGPSSEVHAQRSPMLGKSKFQDFFFFFLLAVCGIRLGPIAHPLVVKTRWDRK